MTSACDLALDWYAEQGVGVLDDPPTTAAQQSAHIASCEQCRGVVESYSVFAEACKQELHYAPEATAESDWISAARESLGEIEVAESLFDVLRHSPSPAAEDAFLAAASAQKATSIPKSTRSSRGVRVLALAAVALLAVGAMAWQVVTWSPNEVEPVVAADASLPILIASQSGQVHLLDAANQETSALAVGTRIQTEVASHLQFEQVDNAVITVNAVSDVEVLAWSAETTQLDLHEGTVLAKVVHREPGAVFEAVTWRMKQHNFRMSSRSFL